ncbi:MAG TPA: hypothetical protein VHJ54_07640 [Solirubrobacterales bacterium]|jgi:hypothetical protein|nr:hypothetical protein [Solirubrobacterales bacterium]
MLWKQKLAGVLAALLIIGLAVPSLAFAQRIGPTDSQYGDTATQVTRAAEPVTRVDEPNNPSTGLDSRVGPLPFTGFDVIAMSAVALAVTGLGLGLQRAVSRHPSDQLE